MRILLTASLLIAAALPACAEEIALKDGTKIVGHMTAVQTDKIEVETAYGKMLLKRSDILTISFPENNAAAKKDAPTAPIIEDALQGAQYVNKTSKFSLTLPPEWKINPSLAHLPTMIGALSTRDELRFLLVSREDYTGSLESYKGLLELQSRKGLGSYEELSESPITIDGKPGLLLSYRGTLPKADNLPVQFLVAIIPSGTTFTRIAAWCVEPLFHETQPAFERIMTSYRSTGPASQTAHLAKP